MSAGGELVRLHRRGEESPRLWLDWWTGHGIGPTGRSVQVGARAEVDEICSAAVAVGARVVIWCGERPHGADVAAFTAWRTPAPGYGWAPAPEGHYLRDLLTPVLRYQSEMDARARVDVRSSGEWFGDHNTVSPATAHDAIELVRDLLGSRFYGARVWSSPQATGTDLLLRALPEGGAWAPLPADIAEQIRATSTQGRTETFARPGPLPELVEYDGRFMYSALCGEVPEGEPVTGPGWCDPEALGYRPGTEAAMVRGRFEIEWRPPAGWADDNKVGLVPHLGADGWRWPTDRRWRRGWVSGPEVLLAMRQQWEVKARRHLAWPAGKGKGPLGRWSELLVSARDQAALLTRGTPAEPAVAGALRAILLHTVGVLHSRAFTVTRTAALDDDLPAGRLRHLHQQGDQWVWSDDDPGAGAWRARFAHPEWSDAIWSRCRARLLHGPTVAGVRTGALHVDPATLVAFSTDALYLSADPGWPDDRKVGRLRRKATYPGPFDSPASRADLLAILRNERGQHAHA